jgi:hypothetical protein
MFNDKSTAAERQAVLQALLRRGAQDAAGSPHTPEELNRLLARCGAAPARVLPVTRPQPAGAMQKPLEMSSAGQRRHTALEKDAAPDKARSSSGRLLGCC